LTANPSGERHGVIIPVPIKVMEKAGTYRFVLHFYDDYGDSYKDHEVKPALEVNATESLKVFHIEDDWMVTPDGKELNPLARSPEVKNAFMRAGWIVHTAGSKCKGKTCVLPSVCTKIPYHETLPTEDDRNNYSRDYFSYYDERNKGRYVHVIGAAYMTGKGDGHYGISLDTERYSYVFVRLHLDASPQEANSFIKTTVIHELGHQFGLDHHPPDREPPKTRNGKFCVMWASAPSALIDKEFCDECLKRIRNYRW
jgi:hypothetical protein